MKLKSLSWIPGLLKGKKMKQLFIIYFFFFNINFYNRPVAKYAIVNGVKSLNLASYNFLNMIGNEKINESAIKSIQKYGVGSCGPRGFYGTIGKKL